MARYEDLPAMRDAVMRAALWYAPMPWGWLASTGTLEIRDADADELGARLADLGGIRGGLHVALHALAFGLDGDGPPTRLGLRCRADAERILLEDVNATDELFGRVHADVWQRLGRYFCPLRGADSYDDVLRKRSGGGPDTCTDLTDNITSCSGPSARCP